MERTLQGASTSESTRPGPIMKISADPSLAGGPMGSQLSEVVHLLSSWLPPLQISPACADAQRPLPTMSRQTVRANVRPRTHPAAICPPAPTWQHIRSVSQFQQITFVAYTAAERRLFARQASDAATTVPIPGSGTS